MLALAQQGDPDVCSALQGIGRWVGLGLVALANTFDPDRIAIGGLLARVFPYLRDAVAAEFQGGRWMAAGHVEIVPTRLGEVAACLGGAELALNPILSDPTIMPITERGFLRGAGLPPGLHEGAARADWARSAPLP